MSTVEVEYYSGTDEEYQTAQISYELDRFGALVGWTLVKTGDLAVPADHAKPLAELLGITDDQVERAARKFEGVDEAGW